jgi:hypothetical protein
VTHTAAARRRQAAARAITAAALLLATVNGAAAQRIERVGQGTPDLDRRLDAVIAGQYTVLTENRLVTRTDTLRGTVVVTGATVRIEGVILGDLVGLAGNMFLRPTGVVTGNVLNVVGGFYPSELAEIGGVVLSAPNAPYRVEQTPDLVRVIGLDRRPRFVLEGFRGLMVPSYDRVDGLTVPVGGALLLPNAATFENRLRTRLEYRTARRRLTGGAELVAEREPIRLAAGVERTTVSNELWIQPRWKNSLIYLFSGNDYFDHYEADRVYVEALVRPLAVGPLPVELGVRLQREDARSLAAANPWSLLNRSATRPNRPVDDGRIVSAIAHASTAYSGQTAIASGGALVEFGRAQMPLGWTEPATEPEAGNFGRIELFADVALAGLRNHTLEIDANFRAPLPGTADLPRQRWTHVGGGRTLYTVPIATYHGDRLAHVHTTYAIPIDAVRLPLLGPPTLDLIHVAAMAWTRQEERSLEQNIGAGVRAGFLYLRFMVNPADTGQTELGFGLTLPGRAPPWRDR